MKGILLVVSVLMLAGCASYPDKVQIAEGTQLVEFTTVNQSQYKQTGEMARWSGVIAAVNNKQDVTKLDVLFYPSSSNGRPRTSEEPIGRFRVNVSGFLDPEVYKKGKAITALGEIKAKEIAKIGDYEYEYPTLSDGKVYLWPKVKPMSHTYSYYHWYGNYPSYYWRGGVRHIYVVGKGKTSNLSPTVVKKPTPSKK